MKPEFSEALKLKDGIFYNLAYHQKRVDKTLEKFGGSKIDLAETLAEIAADAKPGTFKCRVVYNREIERIECIPYTPRQPKTVGIVKHETIDYTYKYTDRRVLNELVRQSGCDDVIIIKQGLVTDASFSNLVFEADGKRFTPDTYLLPGTKRQFLLDTGIVTEKRITIDDIRQYDRIRFINAMLDLEDDIFVQTTKLKQL